MATSLESPVVASGSGTVARPGEWSSITKRAFSTHVYDYWQNKAAENEAAGNSKWAVVNKIGAYVLQALTWIGATLGGFIVTGLIDLGQSVKAWRERKVEALELHKLTNEGIAEGLVKQGSALVKLDPNRGQTRWPFTSAPVAGNVRRHFGEEIDAVTRAMARKTDSMNPTDTQAELAGLSDRLTAQVQAIAGKEGRDETTGDVKYNLTMVSSTSAGDRLWAEYLRLGGPNQAVRMDQFIMTLVGGRIAAHRHQVATQTAEEAARRLVSGSASLRDPQVLRDLGRDARRVTDLIGGDPQVVAKEIQKRAKEQVEEEVRTLTTEVGTTTPEDLSARLANLKKLRGLGGSIFTAGQRVAERMDAVDALSGKTVTVPVSVADLRDARTGGTMAEFHSAKAKATQAAIKGLKTEMAQTDGQLALARRRREVMGTEYDRTAQALVENLGVEQFDVNAEIQKAERLQKAHEELAAAQAKLKPPVSAEEPVELPSVIPSEEDRIEEEPVLFEEERERVQELSTGRAYLGTAAKVLGGAAVVGGGLYGIYSYLRGGSSQPVVEEPVSYPNGTTFVNGTLTAPDGTQFRSTEADKPVPPVTPIRQEAPKTTPPRVVVRDLHGGTSTEEPLFGQTLSMPELFPRVEERGPKSGNFTAPPVVTPRVVEDRGNTSIPVGKFSAVDSGTSPVPHVPSFLDILGSTPLMSPANITHNVTANVTV